MDLSTPFVLLAQGLGAGRFPWAPGTLATVMFLLVWWPLAKIDRRGYWAVWALVCLLGVPLCGLAADVIGVHDAASIVWDELGGLLVALAVVPRRISWGLVGALVFRFFDVLKPWPVGWFDRGVGGGLGIVLDDLAAGLYAGAVLYLILRLLIARQAR